jgi:hypothetical protein
MGILIDNHLTITPAEGYDSLPPKLIEKLAYKDQDGYEVRLELGVPIRRRGLISDDYLLDIWGGLHAYETSEVTVSDTLITATFTNRDFPPYLWVKTMSGKFPTAVFHLSFVQEWVYLGGEVTGEAGVLTNEVFDTTVTPERLRATRLEA